MTNSKTAVSKKRSSIDWLTLTSLNSGTREAWKAVFMRETEGQGVPGRWLGFEGLRAPNGAFYGTRKTDGRHILILPGESAHEHWAKVTPCKCRVTRLDMATDIWLAEPSEHIETQAKILMAENATSQCKVTYISGVSGGTTRRKAGNTLYLGSRQSHQFGRLYDKGQQTKLAERGRWLRYEVEFKSSAAKQALAAVQANAPEDIGEFVEGAVHAWFMARGVDPIWTPCSTTPQFHVRSFVRTKTLERRLTWLHTQVKPTIEYLLQEGCDDRITWALGLEGWIDARKLE